MSKKDTYRIVSHGSDGQIRIKDYANEDTIKKYHTQIGVDDCSTDLDIRGMPVFRGLVGPIPEGKNIVRYETPEVFESITKDWAIPAPKRKRSRARKS